MNRKAASIIILCLMVFSIFPISFHTTGGDHTTGVDEKSAKSLVKNLEDEMQKKEKKKGSEK